jgi:hypothetical protein
MRSASPKKSTSSTQSFDGLGTPPVFAHCVSLRQPPCRGRHRWPGKAGSTAPLIWVAVGLGHVVVDPR